MDLRQLIKCFTFGEADRSQTELHALARINPDKHYLELLPDLATGLYPTDDEVYARTKLTSPKAVRKWVMFETNQTNVTDEDDNPLTSVGFRLSDGTDDYWWNGATWVVAAVGEWSTEAEVSTNVGSFLSTVGTPNLQLVVNLKTTDERYTPRLSFAKFLFDADIDFREDIILRSLIPALRANVKPWAEYKFASTSVLSEINVGLFKFKTKYKIIDVCAVYNTAQDPDLTNNILDTYDTGTKIATLTVAVPADEAILIRFIYEPMVAITTSQDFIEADRVPAIHLDDVGVIDAYESAHDAYVANKSTGEAKIVPAPTQGDIQVNLLLVADKETDMFRLSSAVERFFANNKFLVSTGLDERYRLWLMDEFIETTVPDQKELRSCEASFRIMSVNFWNRDAQDGYLVTSPPKVNVIRMENCPN